ncbi:hypothetical protein NECAME_05800 [Necator americanus]|uniref:Uncharacterized protein n=1 Tax=Necator americanus TaxID=51031 RepID=W2TY91_NECAM|nr:hypothetical protein NECAME_05800 [Necator americanus]ETN86808.1 hypothetical protein NECAME_05800 [Necator americanus]
MVRRAVVLGNGAKALKLRDLRNFRENDDNFYRNDELLKARDNRYFVRCSQLVLIIHVVLQIPVINAGDQQQVLLVRFCGEQGGPFNRLDQGEKPRSSSNSKLSRKILFIKQALGYERLGTYRNRFCCSIISSSRVYSRAAVMSTFQYRRHLLDDRVEFNRWMLTGGNYSLAVKRVVGDDHIVFQPLSSARSATDVKQLYRLRAIQKKNDRFFPTNSAPWHR